MPYALNESDKQTYSPTHSSNSSTLCNNSFNSIVSFYCHIPVQSLKISFSLTNFIELFNLTKFSNVCAHT